MKDFQRIQYQFAAHLRDPSHNPIPDGIEERRIAVYRDLFFSNVEGFLSSAFPVLKSLYTPAQWSALARAFFSQHYCKTPYFLQIAQEFLQFLQHSYQPKEDDFVFLLELAHYEWTEVALMVAEETAEDASWFIITDPQAWLQARLYLQSTAWSLSYNYPVQRIGPHFIPTVAQQEPTFLIVYRDQQDKVGFMQINPLTARLLELVEEGVYTTQQLIACLQLELPNLSVAQIQQGVLDIVMTLNRQFILRGEL